MQKAAERQFDVSCPSCPLQVAETRRAEFSPAQFAGPKKISLNHLLNFTFEPRGGGVGDVGPSCWGRRNKWGHKHKPFNKELFLQAKSVLNPSTPRPPTVPLSHPPIQYDIENLESCVI